MAAAAPMVCWLSECQHDALPLVGGKCASLGELIHAGIRVPPGFAITTAAYRAFMQERGLDREVAALTDGKDAQDVTALEAASAAARRLIEDAPFSTELEDLVAEHYRKLSVECCMPAAPVAVRSSATAEDLPGASFAGQQDTFLWIRGVDDLLAHARRCISSLYTGRAMAYRARNGFRHEDVAIAVAVQKMANAYTAGVMFTLNPSNGDRSSIVIDANFGFGESVVSGEVTPDHFVVNKVSLDIVERTIPKKEVAYTVDTKAQRSYAHAIPLERQHVQCVIDDEVTQLAWMGKRIEKHYGRPMDIEWAIDKNLPAGGNILILQARPETVWSSRQAAARPASAGQTALDHIVASMMQGARLN
ncbi:MAG TPA: PEP/pyruvate-binding domain-containing protein [Anaeromyxobacteraceae bacterium]|nr:PEP/pyruvate-binding domain-containing protein [Anaeromyxobacteraceae bacterium]